MVTGGAAPAAGGDVAPTGELPGVPATTGAGLLPMGALTLGAGEAGGRAGALVVGAGAGGVGTKVMVLGTLVMIPGF